MNTWDTYFYSHYRPTHNAWGSSDVEKYCRWYFSWIEYIEKKCPVLQKKARIFEIGSAIGSVAKLLHDRGHDVRGSDIARKIVGIANTISKPVSFVYCDIQKLIPIQKKFDVIMGFEVLEHVPKLKNALKNIKRSLRQNGYFIGTSPYPYPKNYLDRTHVFVAKPEVWKQLFLKAGFSNVETFPMSFFPLIWRLSKYVNLVIPMYIPWPFFVSTTLIIARK